MRATSLHCSSEPSAAPFGFARATTLAAALIERAQQGNAVAAHFLSDDPIALGCRDLLARAGAAAAVLASRGVAAGDRVLLVLETGPAFPAAFYGCQLLGAIPVPVVPPWSRRRADAQLARIAHIADVCGATAAIVTARLRGALARAAHENALLDTELGDGDRSWTAAAAVSPDDAAFIQFTSGSTGDPKGVVVSHRAVLANCRAIGTALEYGPNDILGSWVPLYHDMGLVGVLVNALAWGLPSVFMAPERFLRAPLDWLHAVERFGVTVATAPNFSYDLCVARANETDLAALDLSRWRVALCGGEPVQPRTLARFSETFSRCGFRPGAFLPVYGLAELTLAATFPPLPRLPRVDRVVRRELETGGRALPAPASIPDAETLAWCSVGGAMPGGHRVRVVDTDRQPVADRIEGDIEVTGPSLASGYYRAPEATAATFRDGWLVTGDRGYLADGELYVTGRRKEIIIVRGRNLYPHDIEAAAAAMPGIRAGRCAAFGIPNDADATEDLVVICETRARRRRWPVLEAAVRAAVVAAVGVRPLVVIAPPGLLPKTSSGKIQRAAIRRRYLAGDLRPNASGLSHLLGRLLGSVKRA